MNDTQKDAIAKLAESIERIVPYLYTQIGEQLATELLDAATELKGVMREHS